MKLYRLNRLLIFIFLIFVITAAGCNNDRNQSASEAAVNNVITEAEQKVNKTVPADLTQCSKDMFSSMSNCMDLPDDKVCGYDNTIYEDGREQVHGLEYRTPCHYCNFFGDDMEKDMMGTIVKGLGYKRGACK